MPETLLTINAASKWLRARGIRPYSRANIYLAVARCELRITAQARVMLIRESDLEQCAKALQHETTQ